MACLRVNIEVWRKRDALLCVPFSGGSEQTGLSGRDANIRRRGTSGGRPFRADRNEVETPLRCEHTACLPAGSSVSRTVPCTEDSP